MKITNEDLRWAASKGIVPAEQATELWEQLSRRLSSRPRFDAANVAYYFGALIVIGAMGWFVTEAWERVGGLGLFSIAAAYAAAFVLAGHTLWDRQRLGGGLSVMDSGSESSRFMYCLINVGHIALSGVLRRRVFIVFGPLGVLGYLGRLSYTVFKDSYCFRLP
jgi:hypothetical protein